MPVEWPFLDLKKAFDTVDHRILVSKLSEIGLDEHALQWVESYLYGRTQLTVVNGHKSSTGKIQCGVPQGSILGPLFFILYVNSLPNILHNSKVYLYADDTAIAVRGNNTESIVNCLNEELKHARVWFDKHRLSLNLKKTRVMFFGTHNRIADSDDVHVSCNGVEIAATKSYKYLGVSLDSKLTFSEHVESISFGCENFFF